MNKNMFTTFQMNKPKRNVFDLTHDVKFSMKMGDLVPVCVMDCVPGDKFTIGSQSLVRFAPMVAPVMHRFDSTIHYFFVPTRLVWPDWEKFITGDTLQGPTGPHPVPVVPTISLPPDGALPGTLANYLGLPNPIANTLDVSAIPFACYQKIYDDYYRDENLIAPVNFTLDNGGNGSTTGSSFSLLRKRAWEHDYFTSALPWSQKGEQVRLPIAPNADVPVKVTPPVDYGAFFSADGTSPGGATSATVPSGTPLWADPGNESSYYAETSLLGAVETTINELRTAFSLQKYLERNARGGTRYIEWIKAFFGVTSSDKRLQRAEYITGIKSPIVVSEVLNTAGTEDQLPQGNMAGHGVGVTSGRYGKYFCEEHGYIIGIMSVTPKTAYQQGVQRHWSRTDRLDYYVPDFANLGEQAITNKEIYCDADAPDDEFGYIPRFSEYKYMPSRVAGEFQTTLAYWHDGRIFDTPPALNQQFVECVPDPRIFAVETGDNIFCHVLNQVKAVRSMPFFGNPGGLL